MADIHEGRTHCSPARQPDMLVHCTWMHTKIHSIGSKFIMAHFLSPLWKIIIPGTRQVRRGHAATNAPSPQLTSHGSRMVAGPHKSKTPDENPIMGFYTKEVHGHAPRIHKSNHNSSQMPCSHRHGHATSQVNMPGASLLTLPSIFVDVEVCYV